MKSKFVISAALLLGSLSLADAAFAKSCKGLEGEEAVACTCEGKKGAALESCQTRTREIQEGSAKTIAGANKDASAGLSSHASQAGAQIKGGDVSKMKSKFGG